MRGEVDRYYLMFLGNSEACTVYIHTPDLLERSRVVSVFSIQSSERSNLKTFIGTFEFDTTKSSTGGDKVTENTTSSGSLLFLGDAVWMSWCRGVSWLVQVSEHIDYEVSTASDVVVAKTQ